MLGELGCELRPAARVLVLELNARRPERVTVRRLRHSELLELAGRRLGLLGALLTLVGRRTVAAAADHQRAGAIRISEPEMDDREAAHRQPDNMRLVDLERVEHGTDIVA